MTAESELNWPPLRRGSPRRPDLGLHWPAHKRLAELLALPVPVLRYCPPDLAIPNRLRAESRRYPELWQTRPDQAQQVVIAAKSVTVIIDRKDIAILWRAR